MTNQIYLNSGTWRPVHELARFHPGQKHFVGYHVMTYLNFFKGDERKGKAFEGWTGALESSLRNLARALEAELLTREGFKNNLNRLNYRPRFRVSFIGVVTRGVLDLDGGSMTSRFASVKMNSLPSSALPALASPSF